MADCKTHKWGGVQIDKETRQTYRVCKECEVDSREVQKAALKDFEKKRTERKEKSDAELAEKKAKAKAAKAKPKVGSKAATAAAAPKE